MTNTVELNQTEAQILKDLLARVSLNGKPVTLSIKGGEDLVVLNASSYRQLLEEKEEAETIAAIWKGWEAAKAGRVRPYKEVMEEIRKEFGFSEPSLKTK